MSKSSAFTVIDLAANLAAALCLVARPLVAGWVRWRGLVTLRSRVTGPVPVTTQFDGRVAAVPGSRVQLGEHVRLGDGVFFETAGDGRITVGEDVRINTGTLIASHALITIGDDVLIGEYVSLRDANHGTADMAMPIRQQPHEARPIVIEGGAWIGRGVCILGGVTLGSGAVVAANSVVTKDVPSQAIVGGVPARLIRMRDGSKPDTAANPEPRPDEPAERRRELRLAGEGQLP